MELPGDKDEAEDRVLASARPQSEGHIVSISYQQFVDQVRRHNPAQLLRAVSQLDPKWNEPGGTPDQWQILTPWGLAVIARESLLWGNYHRRDTNLQEAELRRLHLLFANTYERDEDKQPDSALEILTRHVHEQFPFQESDFEEITRTVAILRGAAAATPECALSNADVDALVGMPLEDAVGAALAIYVICQAQRGTWADVLERPDLMPAFDGIPPANIRSLLAQMTTDQQGFKAAYAAAPLPTRSHLRRWTFNPLSQTPLIRLPDGQIVAPQPRYILRRVTLNSLYYVGTQQHGSAFARALGPIVETYVGQQLRLATDARVEPEIEWGSPIQKSIDWFLVLPNCVVLVEVKSTRLTLGARAGDSDLVDKVQKSLDKAVRQIKRSAEMVRNGHPAFAHIPNDRPLIGLIVTAEPVYMANSDWVREVLSTISTPTLFASLRELESLTPQTGTALGTALLTVIADDERRQSLISSAMRGLLEDGRNPILDAAAETIPMLARSRSEQEADEQAN